MNIFEQYAMSDLLHLRESEADTLVRALEKHLDLLNDQLERMKRQGEEYQYMLKELYFKLYDIVLDEYEMSVQELDRIERLLTDIEVF